LYCLTRNHIQAFVINTAGSEVAQFEGVSAWSKREFLELPCPSGEPTVNVNRSILRAGDNLDLTHTRSQINRRPPLPRPAAAIEARIKAGPIVNVVGVRPTENDPSRRGCRRQAQQTRKHD